MTPIRVSHTIAPLRPGTAPSGDLPPCSPAGLTGLRHRMNLDCQGPTFVPMAAMPSPSGLRRPGTPSALGFGLEFAQAPSAGYETGMAPPTPTNSIRRATNANVLMMPRSNRSMRHNVLQARNAEEIDTVPLAPQPALLPSRPATATASGVSSTLMERRAALLGGGLSLGADVMQTSTSTWVANGLSTPKNRDRRDLTGSVECMAPLWRGSASDMVPLHVQAARPPMMTSPPRGTQCGYARPDLPMSPTLTMSSPVHCASPTLMMSSPLQAPLVAEDSVLSGAPLLMGTPKNSQRFNAMRLKIEVGE